MKQTENREDCIKIIDSILGLPSPDIIESYFENGFINAIANLTWVDKNIQIIAYTKNGQLNGMFKAHDMENNVWMIGTLTNNELKDNQKD